MYYNENQPLFTTLYDVRSIIQSIPEMEMTALDQNYHGNLHAIRLRLPMTMKGLKSLDVILSVAWEPTVGKGFVCGVDYRASATIGDVRSLQIQNSVARLFETYALEKEQPEGVYEKYGTYRSDKRVGLVKRISTTDLVPLYTYRYEHSENSSTVYRMGAALIETHEYATDFIDENGTRYSRIRSITSFEDKHGFLLSVSKYRVGYVTYQDASVDVKARITIHHDCLLSPAPQLVPDTVLFDEGERKYAKIIEEQGQLYLQYESGNHRGTYDPFVLSDRFVVTEDVAFEVPTAGLYYDTNECLLYRAIQRRPNYMVVELVDGNPFPKRNRNVPETRTGVVPLWHIVELNVDYKALTDSGMTAFQETDLAEIVVDLFKRTRTVMEKQMLFWIGLAIEHYGGLEKACHGVYFALVEQMRHTSANTEEVKAFLQTLLKSKLIEAPIDEEKSA